MGLDNFWRLPSSEVPHPVFNPSLNLCGGLFSAHGSPSFRGKVYAEFCENVMHINLYQEVITSDEIKQGLDKLNDYIESDSFHISNYSKYDLTSEEILDLQKMFTEYSNLGAALESWY